MDKNNIKKKNKNQLGEHYAISNTNKFIGYMTFHYLLRFVRPDKLYMLFNDEVSNYEDLKNLTKVLILLNQQLSLKV